MSKHRTCAAMGMHGSHWPLYKSVHGGGGGGEGEGEGGKLLCSGFPHEPTAFNPSRHSVAMLSHIAHVKFKTLPMTTKMTLIFPAKTTLTFLSSKYLGSFILHRGQDFSPYRLFTQSLQSNCIKPHFSWRTGCSETSRQIAHFWRL